MTLWAPQSRPRTRRHVAILSAASNGSRSTAHEYRHVLLLLRLTHEDIQDACLRVQEGGSCILNWPRRANGGTLVADLADTEGNEFTLFSPPE